jgi:hypothetical protein
MIKKPPRPPKRDKYWGGAFLINNSTLKILKWNYLLNFIINNLCYVNLLKK